MFRTKVNTLALLAIAFHFALCILHNLEGCIRGQLEIAAGDHTSPIETGLSRLLDWPPIRIYAQYSGIACGYGFFSPQVASQYRWHYHLAKQPMANTLATGQLLNSLEGQLRFHTFTDIFQHLLPTATATAPADTLQYRLARAVSIALCQRVLKIHEAHCMHCRVLLRHPLPLREPDDEQAIQYFTLHEHEITAP